TGPTAIKRALDQIDAVREAVRTHPNDLVLATTAAEIRQAHAAKKIAALMGVEGGHMIDSDLALLRTYYALGVRYMTLTHSLNTPWADSSGDRAAHDGLAAFGKDVVREMNRLGMMVDIDHVAKVAGVDHAGLGSDFDGATMPIGMESAAGLPKITDALLKKGYSEADVEKILGGNILRVMEQVERAAARR